MKTHNAPTDLSGPADPSGATGCTATPLRRLTEVGAKRFLDELAEIGSVHEAARRARVPRASLYRRRDNDADFAAAWDKAIQLAVDRLQDEAMMRAIEGVERPVYYKGVQVDAVRQVSDRLLMFLLRAHRRETFDPGYIKPWMPPEPQVETETAFGALLHTLSKDDP